VSISEKSSSLKLTVSTFTAQGGFVISEIFFTGTSTAEGGSYSGDQYIRITNNSDVTLYADSIVYQPWTEVQELSEIDWLMLNMVYSPHVDSGMSYKEVYAVLYPTIVP
jgi:hypothetical protein